MKPTSPRELAKALALLRIALGVVAIAAPALPATSWVGRPDARRSTTRVLARALGGRDVALGVGAIVATNDAELCRAVVLGGIADAVDALATLVAFRRLPRRTRFATLAVTSGAAMASAVIAGALGQ